MADDVLAKLIIEKLTSMKDHKVSADNEAGLKSALGIGTPYSVSEFKRVVRRLVGDGTVRMSRPSARTFDMHERRPYTLVLK